MFDDSLSEQISPGLVHLKQLFNGYGEERNNFYRNEP